MAIVGPTAVGKSRLALGLASEYSAEIVTADSRQVYRYMDIGTAKPSLMERVEVPHYMIDLVQPDERYSAHLYREEGVRVLHRIGAAGRVAFVVGGTGFYVRALLDGVSLPPVPPDPTLRAHLRQQAEQEGAAALHQRLRVLDPASAKRIHPNNLPRVIRALEVAEYLGGAVPEKSSESCRVQALYLGLRMDRERLRAVANRRVHSQVAMGLVDETRLLLMMGYEPEAAGLQGFGYRQMVAYLQGRTTLAEAIASYQTATQQYIRRQMTWFRADERIQWIEANTRSLGEARERINQWLAGRR